MEFIQSLWTNIEKSDLSISVVLVALSITIIIELVFFILFKRKREQHRLLDEKINRLLYVNQVNNELFSDHILNTKEFSEYINSKDYIRYNFYDDDFKRMLRHLYLSQQNLHEEIEKLNIVLASTDYNQNASASANATTGLNAVQLIEQVANMTNIDFLLELLKDDNEKKYTIMRNVISDIAHTLRTPLSGIHAILLILGQSYSDNAELVKYFSEIDKCLSQVENNIQAYQDLMLNSQAKNESDEVGFIDELSARLKIAILTCDKKLYVDISNVESISTDSATSNLLLLALDCLIENATYFANDNSTIRVSGHSDGEFYIFEVQNEGQFIAEENLKKIFLNGFSTRSSSGKGLFFVKNVIEARLNGIIDCENVEEPAKGVRFIILLEKDRLYNVEKEARTNGENTID